MLDVLKISRLGEVTADGYQRIDVDPADLYPSTIAHIVDVLKSGASVSGPLASELAAARDLPDQAWADALIARRDFDDSQTLEIDQRRQALEIARRWYTEMLHQAIGRPISIRITKNLHFKL